MHTVGCVISASRINSSRPRFSLTNHPLAYVLRAMHDLDAARLADIQETNYFHIHKGYFLQVQDTLRVGRLELLLQLANVRRLKASYQADRCLSALRISFDLQCPLYLIEANTEHDCNSVAITID